MIELIDVPKGSSFFLTTLDGESVRIDLYYVRSEDRYRVDVENKRLNRRAVGLAFNVGVDLLAQAGRLGLQALVLVSMPQPRVEASLGGFPESLQLAYMDMATYNDLVLGGGFSRQQWIERTPNGL